MLNLGSLNFTLGVNTQGLAAARTAIEAFGRSASQSQAAANRGLDSQIAKYMKVESAILSAGEKLNSFIHRVENADLAPDVQAGLIRDAEKAFSALSLQMADTKKLSDGLFQQRHLAAYRNELNELSRTLTTTVAAEKELGRGQSTLDKARQAEAQASAQARFTQALRDSGVAYDGVRKKASESASAFESLLQAQEKVNNAKGAEAQAANLARADELLRSQGVRWGQTSDKVKSASASMDVFVQNEKQAKALADEAARAITRQASEAKKAESASIGQARALAGAVQQAKNLENSIQLSGLAAAAPLTDRIQAALNRLKGTLQGAEPLKPREFMQAATQYKAELGDIRRSFQQVKNEEMRNGLDPEAWRKLKAQLQAAGSTMLLINGHLGGMSTRMFALGTLVKELNIGWAAGVAAMAGFATGLTMIVKGTLTTTMQLEKAEKALAAVMGSMAAAGTEMSFLKDVARDTGQVYTEMTQSYAKFAAASITAGQTSTVTQQQFRDMAFVTGHLGLTVEDTQGVFRAFEQILSKGTVQAEELRGQLGDRLPGAFAIAARSAGKTQAEFNALTKKGEVISKDFLPKFIEGLKEAYNIDTGKAVDTLQASLNRATNSITDFFDAVRKNTQVVAAAKAILEGFGAAVDWVTKNMRTIIEYTVSITGAIIGAAAAWAAWHAVIIGGAVLLRFAAWMTTVISLMRTAKTITEMMTVAQMALNAAMTANPVGAVVGLLAKLAVVLGGAYAGYQLLNGALATSAEKFEGSLASIEDYISRQKELGFQVDTVTQKLIVQAAVLAKTMGIELQKMGSDLKRAAAEGPKFGDYIAAGMHNATNALSGTAAKTKTMKDAWRDRVAGMTEATREMTNMTRRAMTALGELQNMDLPDLGEMYKSSSGVGSDDSGKAKKAKEAAEENIDAILELIRAMDQLKEKQKVLEQGPEGIKLVEYLYDAQDIIRDFSSTELAMADEALRKVGLTTGSLAERLSGLIGAVDKSKEALDQFISTWEEVDDVQKDIALNQEKLNDLLYGGGKNQDWLDDFQDAMGMIDKMDTTQLEALALRLTDLGYPLASGSDGMRSLAAALADFFGVARQGEDAIGVLKDLNDEIGNLNKRSASNMTEVAGLQMGLRDGDLDRWVRRQELVTQHTKALAKQGLTAEQVAQQIGLLNAALDDADLTDKILESQQRLADFKDDLAKAFTDFAGEVMTNFKNIGDAAKRLVQRLQQMFMEELLLRPLFNQLKNLFSSLNFSTLGFADGGYVRGPGTSTSDSINARLSDGEYVFKASAVRKWGVSTLEAMNSGRVPAFSDGGYVGSGKVGRGDPYANPMPAARVSINVSTPDANSFVKSRRQVRKAAKRSIG